MGRKNKVCLMGLLLVTLMVSGSASASLAGKYKAALFHEGTNFYQWGEITLTTSNPSGGELKISANVRIFFGDWNSNEYLTYDFPVVPRNLLTGQLTMKEATTDVSFIGVLKAGSDTITGEWYSTLIGLAGNFEAKKDLAPEVPEDAELVTTVTGDYRGSIVNTHAEVNLPERATMSLVTRQDTENPEGGVIITGSTRFYYGEFGSFEYDQTEFEDIQFNFYNRFFTARTKEWGIVYKGTLAYDGTFDGIIYADGFGEVGTIQLQ